MRGSTILWILIIIVASVIVYYSGLWDRFSVTDKGIHYRETIVTSGVNPVVTKPKANIEKTFINKLPTNATNSVKKKITTTKIRELFIPNDDPYPTTVETFNVGPERVMCVGAFPQECLIVNGGYFYDSIEGFDFQEGYNYTLLVNKTQKCDPYVINSCPQDVGYFMYELNSLISKSKA